MFLIVLFTAFGVGGATMLGALGGYFFRNAARRIGGETVTAFAAGIMTESAVSTASHSAMP